MLLLALLLLCCCLFFFFYAAACSSSFMLLLAFLLLCCCSLFFFYTAACPSLLPSLLLQITQIIYQKVILRSSLADSFFTESTCIAVFLTKVTCHQAVQECLSESHFQIFSSRFFLYRTDMYSSFLDKSNMLIKQSENVFLKEILRSFSADSFADLMCISIFFTDLSCMSIFIID